MRAAFCGVIHRGGPSKLASQQLCDEVTNTAVLNLVTVPVSLLLNLTPPSTCPQAPVVRGVVWKAGVTENEGCTLYFFS